MDRIIRLKIPSVGEYECVHISWLFHLKRYICTSVAFHKVLQKKNKVAFAYFCDQYQIDN